jgi:plasmid stabilization system protein ParE
MMFVPGARKMPARHWRHSGATVVWRVKLTSRALRDLDHSYNTIEAASSTQAAQWFARLERAIFSLETLPLRDAQLPEDATLRQLLHGRKPHVYRVIYAVDKPAATVYVLHIRGPRRDRINR